EALGKFCQLVGQDPAFDHFKAALAGKTDDRLSGNAVQEAIGDRGVNLAVPDEKDIGAGALRHATFPVQHHRISVAFALSPLLRDGANLVETGRFGAARRSLRIRSAVFSEIESNSLEPLLRVKVARPFPACDRKMDRIALRRNSIISDPRQAT